MISDLVLMAFLIHGTFWMWPKSNVLVLKLSFFATGVVSMISMRVWVRKSDTSRIEPGGI